MVDNTIWCVVGFCHPNLIDDIKNNFFNQKYPYKKLIIVENGNGIGKWKKTSDQEYILQSNFTGASKPLNEGIKLAKQLAGPNDWWAKWDDDDLYLPNYLQSIIDVEDKEVSVVGRYTIWIRDENNEMWFCEGPSNCYSDFKYQPKGPTIVAKINCPFFPEIGGYSEDYHWLKLIQSLGLKIWLNPANGFIWRRFGPEHNHVWLTGINSFKSAVGKDMKKVISGNPYIDNCPKEYKDINIDVDFDHIRKELIRIKKTYG
jgi:hypothetical protein